MSNVNHGHMGASLYLEILEKLIDDQSIDDHIKNLVDAALRGTDDLSKALEHAEAELSPPSRPPRSTTGTRPPRVFLKEISVRGFRGASPRATLPLDHRPGLTLVVGRNGTGKSTFADGLEVLLTGTTQRWKDVTGSSAGWKNLGSKELPEVSCQLVADGIGLCAATRTWNHGAELRDSKMTLVEEETKAEHRFDWASACASERPFLSYRQLGAVAEDPLTVFDALHSVLGLELFDTADRRISDIIKRLTDKEKEVKGQKDEAETTLSQSTDRRGTELLALVRQKRPEFAELEKRVVALTSEQGEDDSELSRFARANIPTPDEWDGVTRSLADAIAAFRTTHSEALKGNDTLLEVLDKALPHIDSSHGTCPVCSTPLDTTRIQELRDRANALRASTRAFREAEKLIAAARRGGTDLLARVVPTPIALRAQLSCALSVESVAELSAAATSSHERLLNALESRTDIPLLLSAAQNAALVEIEKRGLAFERLLRPLKKWLGGAQSVQRDKELLTALKKAKSWLKLNAVIMRAERFAPLEQATLQNWEQLGADSSVLLRQVKLTGSKNQRKLELHVEVDGEIAPGVAVLSQGEVNCMALSLFLPRAIQQDGPFRFVLIDDPVQAMDQVKVDGLAQVLRDASRHLQVIVFTHDTRLVDSVRRLQIEANILEVQRKANSELVVRKSGSAVEQYLSDAYAVAMSKDTGEELPVRVVPGFCRMSVEASCQERIYRRRLPRGESYDGVDDLVRRLGLFELLALALYDDERAGERVPDYFKNARAFKECEALFQMKETHLRGPSVTRLELEDLVRWSREICKRVSASA